MKFKKLLAVLLTAVLLMGMLSMGICSYAVLMVETQFTYDSVNLSWLKDLIVKEDMSSIDSLAFQQTELEPVSTYPYRHTAASFSEEVAYYQVLYTLDEGMADVAYLYILQIVESLAASSASSSFSDEYIRSYLESLGVVYPSGDAENSSETLIVARALFSVLSADETYTIKRGTGLYEAFTSYISVIVGVDMSYILKFDSDGKLTGLEEYVLSACRYMLYNMGYDVNSSTSDEEIYRLIAIMTIKSQGISIDTNNATFDEIKVKYLCAMLCEIYGVSINVADFEEAVNENKLAFYMLQLIGKQNGVAVKSSVTYEEAFDIVSKNTDYFDLEAGEFYADIFEYNVRLKYIRDKIWFYPQTLGTTSESEGTTVNVKINGKDVQENYYVDVALDSSLEKETVNITVEYTDKSGTISSTYAINVYQGNEAYVPAGSTISGALSGVTDIVTELLNEVGLDSSIANIVKNIPFELPERIFSISSLLLPSFDTGSLGSSFLSALFGYSSSDDSNVETDQLGGVAGLDSFNSSGDSTQSMDFTGNLGNIGNIGNISNIQISTPGMETTTNSANEVVIGDNQQIDTPLKNDDSGNWLSELFGDAPTVIILVVVLVLTFAVCLILFLNILKGREAGKGKDRRSD
ncbi:MAG: cadherin-like beta sandwich domain-containing protein [Clostridia bacterium]|nr:cadherin-like beta sandwich domain-containing protein [Clostridia bacterium]